jgi:arylsulfatase
MTRIVATILIASLVSNAPAADLKRPNIVVILSDDMGFSDLGCMGGEIATPNLDALAAGGVRFTQFYNTARCCPTRASLLTGLHPHQAGVGHMTEDKGLPGYRGDISKECRTIAEQLKPAGYLNYAVGKWHITRHAAANGPKDNWPLARGFDRFYGTIHGAGSYYDPSSLIRDNTMISAFADPEYSPKTYYYTDAITEHAARFVGDHAKEHSEQPFFLYVAYTAAHWPMHALPEDIAKYKGKYDAGYEPIRKVRYDRMVKLSLIDPAQPMTVNPVNWDNQKNKAWESACMEVYAAMVDRMDQGIGKLISELKRTGQWDNTLILFLQDNGACAEPQGRAGTKAHPNIDRPAAPTLAAMKPTDFALAGSVPAQTRDGYPIRMGPKAMPGTDDTYVAYGRGWATVSNTPFREYKHWVHEGGISTPLIAHWPHGIAARGELRAQPGQLPDIAATCLDVARATSLGPTPEGTSLRPAFENKPVPHVLYWEHEGNRAIRVGDWKLVSKYGKPWELFDTITDRVESHNTASANPETVKDLATKWESWAKRTNVVAWDEILKRSKK